MTNEIRETSVFQWTPAKRAACAALAEGRTQKEAAQIAEVTDRSIRLWLDNPEFSAEVDKLTLLTGISLRSERLRIIKRLIRQKVKDDGAIKTDKDLLEWLKYAQSETNGTDLLEQLVASLTTA
jgi:hypothetical protein